MRQEAALLGYRPNFTIYDEDDSTRLIKHCLEDLRLDFKRFPPQGALPTSSLTPRTSWWMWMISPRTPAEPPRWLGAQVSAGDTDGLRRRLLPTTMERRG